MTTLTDTRTDTTSPDRSDGSLTDAFIHELNEGFNASPTCRLAQNAVTQTSADDVALNRSIITSTDHTFSTKLDAWTVTNQKKSGRCWLFAALNLFRVGAMRAMNLESFEFSQNHALFWDKFERANYFLESIIETSDRDVDDRTVAFLLDRPFEDGGKWNMFVNIIKKHGLVPKAAMPESESSSNTRRMNANIIARLREGARDLRALHASGATIDALRTRKHELLADVHRMLSIHLGTPPETFEWQWNDKDGQFHRDGRTTPQEFANRYIEIPYEEYICVVNDPRETSPYNRTFTVEYLGNVVGGDIVKYLNVEMHVMKQLAMETLTNGEPVWMGCDVGKMMRRDLGIWDANLFDYETLYGTSLSMSKADRLVYHEACMTHAMLFTGVDVSNGKPRRWRVENSWGEENGQKGFYVMNDSWFDEHMFEIAVRKSALSPELQRAFDETEPIMLPAWDPMGALAGGS